MLAHGGGSGGGGGGGGHGGGGGGFGGASVAATPRGGAGPMMMQGGNMGPIRGGPMATAPMIGGRVQGWSGRTAWGNNHFHDHFHNRFRNRNFFAFGFGGPIYDYAYSSCWAQVDLLWLAYVCGDHYGY